MLLNKKKQLFKALRNFIFRNRGKSQLLANKVFCFIPVEDHKQRKYIRFYESAGIQILLNKYDWELVFIYEFTVDFRNNTFEDGRKVEIKALLKQVQKDNILISLLLLVRRKSMEL